MRRKKGFFSISAVAEMFSVHQQTIRLYEKEGLIAPKRSDGNTRLFSEEDVNKLEEIIYLTHQLGINLAGVQMILKLQKKINKLQKQMNQAFDDVQADLEKEGGLHTQDAQIQLKKLAVLRPPSLKGLPAASQNAADESPISHSLDEEQWEIEYDE